MAGRQRIFSKSIIAAKNASKFIWDLIFPIFCLRCGREGEWLCKNCLALCPSAPLQRCVFCHELTPFGETCQRCHRRHALDGVIVRGVYQSWVWQPLIKNWKYRGARELGEIAASQLADLYVSVFKDQESIIIVPVSLAKKRERERGFNQALVLASSLKNMGTLAPLALRRVRETKPQSTLAPQNRQKNVAGSFVANPDIVKGKACVLVDDIVTTGATMEAAARALKEAGAAAVWGMALVRSELREYR